MRNDGVSVQLPFGAAISVSSPQTLQTCERAVQWFSFSSQMFQLFNFYLQSSCFAIVSKAQAAVLYKELEFSLDLVAYCLCVCSEVEFWGCTMMLVEKKCVWFKTGHFKGFFSRLIVSLICCATVSMTERAIPGADKVESLVTHTCPCLGNSG